MAPWCGNCQRQAATSARGFTRRRSLFFLSRFSTQNCLTPSNCFQGVWPIYNATEALAKHLFAQIFQIECVTNAAAVPPQPVIPQGFCQPPCACATFLPSLASSPTWTLCLYLICGIGESHTGVLNCLPTNYASAQNVIGPRGTVRRHPHSFGFLCANEARRKKRCAAVRCMWTQGDELRSWTLGERAEGPWERRGGPQRRTARIYRGNFSLPQLQLQEGPSHSLFCFLVFRVYLLID